MTYDKPAPPSGGLTWGDHLGALLLITVHGQEFGVQTVHGPADPIRCDIAVIDGPGAGEVNEDTLVFPKVLIGQLKRSIGGKVIGRLGQGAAKPGQSPPWMLTAASAEDETKAVEWETGAAKAAYSPPAPAAGTPPF